jgi:excisionase family DNA binding protein
MGKFSDILGDERGQRMTSSTPGQAPLLLNEREAARSLGISPRKLWALRASGEIPFLRIGRAVRYSVEALGRWIEGQEQGGGTR